MMDNLPGQVIGAIAMRRRRENMRKALILMITAITGLAIWFGVTAVSGEKEAWDSSLYFSRGIPAMLLTSAIAGFIEPKLSRTVGFAVVSLQPIALFISVGKVGPMVPLGLIAFGVVAVLCTGSAYAGAAGAHPLKKSQKNSNYVKYNPDRLSVGPSDG